MFGDGKSAGPDHVLYVGRLDAVGVVSAPADGRKRTVMSEMAELVRGNEGTLVSLLPDLELSIRGNG